MHLNLKMSFTFERSVQLIDVETWHTQKVSRWQKKFRFRFCIFVFVFGRIPILKSASIDHFDALHSKNAFFIFFNSSQKCHLDFFFFLFLSWSRRDEKLDFSCFSSKLWRVNVRDIIFTFPFHKIIPTVSREINGSP